MKSFRKSLSWFVVLSLLLVAVCGCSKDYPPNTEQIKYVNRTSPGGRIDFGSSLLVPKKINVLYFYADW
jgi:hypothetical protein